MQRAHLLLLRRSRDSAVPRDTLAAHGCPRPAGPGSVCPVRHPRSIALINTQSTHSSNNSLFEQEAVVTALADPGGAALRVRNLPEQHTKLLELAAYGRGAVAIANSLPAQIAAAMDWWQFAPSTPETTLRLAMRSISETFKAIDQDSSHRLYETKRSATLVRLVQQCSNRSEAAAQAVEAMCIHGPWGADAHVVRSRQTTAIHRIEHASKAFQALADAAMEAALSGAPQVRPVACKPLATPKTYMTHICSLHTQDVPAGLNRAYVHRFVSIRHPTTQSIAALPQLAPHLQEIKVLLQMGQVPPGPSCAVNPCDPPIRHVPGSRGGL